MNLKTTALCSLTVLVAASAHGQNPALNTLLTKVSGRYRNMDALKVKSTLVQTVEEQELTTDVQLQMRRPNQFLLELKGSMTLTVLNDGKDSYVVRGDRKSYFKAKAPQRLIGSDLMAGQNVPAPASRLIAMAVAGTLREGTTAVSRSLTTAEYKPVSGAYSTVTFPWEDGSLAEVQILNGDFTIRKVTLKRADKPVITETVSLVDYENPVAAEAFVVKLDGLQQVSSLPPFELPKVVKLKEAEDFTLETLDGGKVRLKELRGRTVLITFWKLDDETALEDAKRLSQFQRELSDKGLEIVAVNMGNSADDIKEFLKKNKLKFPVAFNGNGEKEDAAKLLEVEEFPASVVVNPEGKIVAKVVGSSKGDRRVIDALKKLGIQ